MILLEGVHRAGSAATIGMKRRRSHNLVCNWVDKKHADEVRQQIISLLPV